jgi:hypothetical protein
MPKIVSLVLCLTVVFTLVLGAVVPTACHAAGPWPRLPTDGEISTAASRWW